MKAHQYPIACLALCVGSLIFFGAFGGRAGVAAGINYDEARVPKYTLPDPLRRADGRTVEGVPEWRTGRRPELMRLFESYVYGKTPDQVLRMESVVQSTEAGALGGKATRKEVRLKLGDRADAPVMGLLIYLPNGRSRPVPVFLGLNFDGNHTIHGDPGITIGGKSARAGASEVERQSAEKERGSSSRRWPVELILGRGYGLVTAWYGDLEPDRPDGWSEGVRRLFVPNPGQDDFPSDGWGAIGAWAWGLSRALDYLEQDSDVDARRVALLGHSRLGKTALWAGAQDERFRVVISNNSGCGGAALSRRQFGETVERINRAFPHWFCSRFKEYNGREDRLPVDQHELIALLAPRPVYVASATEDLWADPRGEFLAALGAEPVYRLFGKVGLGVTELPAPDQPVGDHVGYHLRTGKHDVTEYDWVQYLAFADRHLGR